MIWSKISISKGGKKQKKQKQNEKPSKRWQQQSIELLLKQNYTLYLTGHWFQPGQVASGLKQTPYCDQHNTEPRVSWPHSDTIKKKKKRKNACKKHVSSESLFYFCIPPPPS